MLWSTALAHIPVLVTFGPEDDWCGFLNGVEVAGAVYGGGDIVVLREGTYEPCAFEALRPTENDEFTVVQSENRDAPARFVHDGTQPSLSVSGRRALFFDLSFEGIGPDQVGVLIEGGHEVGVRFSSFEGQGTAVRVVDPSGFVELATSRVQTGVGVEVACDGCDGVVTVRDALFEGVGAGVVGQADVRDTVFEGGGLALDLTGPAEVSGVLVRSTDGVRLDTGTVANTIVEVPGEALRLDDGLLLGTSVVSGSVALGPGVEAVSNVLPVASGPSNQVCTDACWTDGYLPTPEEPGVVHPLLAEDFCGVRRAEPPTAGALEAGESWGPWSGFKADFDCLQTRIELPPPSEEPQTAPPCGCRTGGAGAMLGWSGMVAFVLGRFRRSTCAA